MLGHGGAFGLSLHDVQVGAGQLLEVGHDHAQKPHGLQHAKALPKEPGGVLPVDVLEHVAVVDPVEGPVWKGDAVPQVPAESGLVEPQDPVVPALAQEPETVEKRAQPPVAAQTDEPTEVHVVPAGGNPGAAPQVDEGAAVGQPADRETRSAHRLALSTPSR